VPRPPQSKQAPTPQAQHLGRQEPGQPGQTRGRPVPRPPRTKQAPTPQAQRLGRQGSGLLGRPPERRATTWLARRQGRATCPGHLRERPTPRSQAQPLRRQELQSGRPLGRRLPTWPGRRHG
jgi:hypothetical protein